MGNSVQCRTPNCHHTISQILHHKVFTLQVLEGDWKPKISNILDGDFDDSNEPRGYSWGNTGFT